VVVGGVRGTATVEEGSVVLRDVPFGTGTPPTQPLTVTTRGYVTEAYPVQISVTTATFETVEMSVADLETTGIVAGHVVDEDSGESITSALVSFEYEQIGGEKVIIKGYTDNQGYYIVGGVPIGRVTVTAAASGFLSAEVVFIVAQCAGQEDPQQLDFALLSGQTTIPVIGNVTDVFTGQEIIGAEVTLGELESVLSDESGNFRIEEVLVGEHQLVVKKPGYGDYKEIIEVKPGMGSVLVQMNKAAPDPPPGPYTIAGKVTLLGAADNSGATVEVFDVINATVAGQTQTNADGNYFVFVLPGDYRITVRYGGQSISRNVTLPGGGAKLTNINFTLTVDP